ncbi:hypothetical protein TWF506_004714 [Arthrobotrys conoides]|uniref:DUF4470 domain-containing protein n=1 Tax=Arthrobotrys conoides TaxID=74498 RepID=A0AAN8RI64_9PEZI
MAAPAPYRNHDRWMPFPVVAPLDLFETVRPGMYLNALILNGSFCDVLHTIYMTIGELGAGIKVKEERPDLNFTLCHDDPYQLTRELVMIQALLHDGVFKDAPRTVIWDIYFNPVIPLQALQVLNYQIHVLRKATSSLQEWKSYILSKVVRIGSLATLKELNRILQRYEGIIMDGEQKGKLKKKMWNQITGDARSGPSWLSQFAEIHWSQNETQVKMEWAMNRLQQQYWNFGRLGAQLTMAESEMNLLFALSRHGDCQRADFAMNPLRVFKSYVNLYNEYQDKTGPDIRQTLDYNDEGFYKTQAGELVEACLTEFNNWGFSLRTASSYNMVQITFTFSDPMEYLHEIRMLSPPNSSVATPKIIREIYSPNSDDTEFDGPANLTYTTIEARHVVHLVGIWNLIFGVIPVLKSPSGVMITDSSVIRGVDNFKFVELSEVFGVDEDTFCTLFGFRAYRPDHERFLDYVKIFGTADIAVFENGRYGFTEEGSWGIDLRVNHAKLDFEYDEILGVVTNIYNAMFNPDAMWTWNNSAATFSLMMYSLKSQFASRFDWPKFSRDVLGAAKSDLAYAQSDEFWVHQHIHGIAPETIRQCNGEETEIETERRLVCITIFIPSSTFENMDHSIRGLRYLDRHANLDALFEINLSHPWKDGGCITHKYRNIRVTTGLLMDPNEWKNYPEAEDNLHVYTGGPILKCSRDPWHYPPKGWTALSFLTGLGLQEFGLKAVSYEVWVINGRDRKIPPVVLQTGLLYEDFEKDVICFSRNFPVLVEDRTLKDIRKNRKKNKKKKGKNQEGEKGDGVENGEGVKKDEDDKGPNDKDVKEVKEEEDKEAKDEEEKNGDDRAQTPLAEEGEGAVKNEDNEGAKTEKNKSTKNENDKVDTVNATQSEKLAKLIHIGGVPDERSIFLQTRQGFDLPQEGEGEGEEFETEKNPLSLSATSKIDICVNFGGTIGVKKIRLAPDQGEGSGAQKALTYSGADSGIGISMTRVDGSELEKYRRLGYDGANDTDEEEDLYEDRNSSATGGRKLDARENKKPSDLKQKVDSSVPGAWKFKPTESQVPRSLDRTQPGQNGSTRETKGKGVDWTAGTFWASKRFSQLQASIQDANTLERSLQDQRKLQDTRGSGLEPDTGTRQQDLKDGPLSRRAIPMPVSPPPAGRVDSSEVPRSGEVPGIAGRNLDVGVSNNYENAADEEVPEQFGLEILTLDILGDDLEELPLDILKFDVLGDDEPRLLEDELPGHRHRRKQFYYWGQRENFDRSKTADKAPVKVDSSVHRLDVSVPSTVTPLKFESLENITSVAQLPDSSEKHFPVTPITRLSDIQEESEDGEKTTLDNDPHGQRSPENDNDDDWTDCTDESLDRLELEPHRSFIRPPRAPAVNLVHFNTDQTPTKKNPRPPQLVPKLQETEEEPEGTMTFDLEDVFKYKKMWTEQTERIRNAWNDKWGCDRWFEKRVMKEVGAGAGDGPKPLLKTEVPVSEATKRPDSAVGALERNKWWKDGNVPGSNVTKPILNLTGQNFTAQSGTQPKATKPDIAGLSIARPSSAGPSATKNNVLAPVKTPRARPGKTKATAPVEDAPTAVVPSTPNPSLGGNDVSMKVPQAKSDETKAPTPVEKIPATMPETGDTPKPPTPLPWNVVVAKGLQGNLKYTAGEQMVTQKLEDNREKPTVLKTVPGEAPERESAKPTTDYSDSYPALQANHKVAQKSVDSLGKSTALRVIPAQASEGESSKTAAANKPIRWVDISKELFNKKNSDAKAGGNTLRKPAWSKDAWMQRKDTVPKKTTPEKKAPIRELQSMPKKTPPKKEREVRAPQGEASGKKFVDELSKRQYRQLFGKRQREDLPAGLKRPVEEKSPDMPKGGLQVRIGGADSAEFQETPPVPQDGPKESTQKDSKEVPAEAIKKPTKEPPPRPFREWLLPPKKTLRRKKRNKGQKEDQNEEPQTEKKQEPEPEPVKQVPEEASSEVAQKKPWQPPTEEQYQHWERPSQAPRDDRWEVVGKGSKVSARQPPPKPIKEAPQKPVKGLGKLKGRAPRGRKRVSIEVPKEEPTEAPIEVPTEAPKEAPKATPPELPEEVPPKMPGELPEEEPVQEPAKEESSLDREATEHSEDEAGKDPEETTTKEEAATTTVNKNDISRKKKKKKGKKKGKSTKQNDDNDESWYASNQPGHQPEGSQAGTEPQILAIQNLEKLEEHDDYRCDETTIGVQAKPKPEPLIPRTKIRFDKSRKHIISRTATIAISDLLMVGLVEGCLLSEIDETPVTEMVFPSGLPGIIYFKAPMLKNYMMISVPCATGLPDSVRWVASKGVEMEFITSEFLLEWVMEGRVPTADESGENERTEGSEKTEEAGKSDEIGQIDQSEKSEESEEAEETDEIDETDEDSEDSEDSEESEETEKGEKSDEIDESEKSKKSEESEENGESEKTEKGNKSDEVDKIEESQEGGGAGKADETDQSHQGDDGSEDEKGSNSANETREEPGPHS